MKTLWAIVAALAMVTGCAGLLHGAEVDLSIGLRMCRKYYGDNPDLIAGRTPEKICALAQVLEPFEQAARGAALAAATRANAALPPR